MTRASLRIFTATLTLCIMSFLYGFDVKAADETGFARAQDRIVAKVNDDIITSGDVWARYHMVQKSANLPDNASIRQDAFPQILDSLINEKVQLQEAKRIGISVTKEDIENGLKDLAERNKAPLEKFLGELTKSGINIDEIKRQSKAQLAWVGVVRRMVRPNVKVTDADIAEAMQKLQEVAGKKEFKIAEIRLPAATDCQKTDSTKLAINLIKEMKKGARFSSVAPKFSEADSVKDGGLRPSVLQGELPPEIENIVTAMPVGALSEPVYADGQIWLVLKLGERMNEGPPPEDELRERIGTLKLEKAARTYLYDLRDEALIEFPG